MPLPTSRPIGDARQRSPAEQAMLRFAAMAGGSGHPVVITGETGSGKTYLARQIHRSGSRSSGPLVRVNCAAIPESLFEREMFGHTRGAFTGAGGDAPGFIEAAHRGTLFLDEIGELPLHLQVKLLSVLEDGTFRRLGSTRERCVDLHLVAATNRDLDRMVAEGRFRRDLFYRISVLRYVIPPLRKRRSDVRRLLDTVLEAESPEPPAVSEAALDLLLRHHWPGNIRELQNVVRSALALSDGAAIDPEHLPPEIRSGTPAAAEDGPAPATRYAAPSDPAEEIRRIEEALTQTGGNRTRAADRLGMSRSTLWAKLHRYGISGPAGWRPAG